MKQCWEEEFGSARYGNLSKALGVCQRPWEAVYLSFMQRFLVPYSSIITLISSEGNWGYAVIPPSVYIQYILGVSLSVCMCVSNPHNSKSEKLGVIGVLLLMGCYRELSSLMILYQRGFL